MAGLTWREGRIVVALVAFCTLCQASQAPNYKCFPFSATQQGTIEPTGDIIREVGTSYEASCLFDPNHVRAEEVFFMHWGKTPKDQYRIQHKVVNDSAISIQVTHEEATEYKLRCLEGNTTFLCERTVKFGYMPQDVKNFTCISKNWTKLNCTWTAPENPVTVRYQLTYVVLGFLDSRECPKSQKGINWCYWGENDFNDRDTWVMTLTAKNPLNPKGVQFEHRISVYENVLPDPPVELVAKVNGPYEVNVTWKLPHPIDVFIGGIVHEVSYRERQDGDQFEEVPWVLVEHKMVMPDRFKTETFSQVISNLHAYIRYDFRVRLHTGTGPIRQHMWSDAAIRTERTAATRPTKAPLTDIGTFEIEETLSHRDIYISWQMVDKLFWNGPNFYYNVSAFEFQTNRPVIKISHEVDIRDAYAKFTNMDKDIAYRFEIIPMNDEGSPDNDLKSVVVVPEMTAILKPIKYFKVFAYGDSNNIYSLRWRLPESQQENQKIESVSLYWCKKDKYEERCQNKLEWVTVEDLNITSKNLTDLKNSSLYMFGISANSNSSSSGIKWHTCIASHGSRPPPLEQFEVTHVSPTEVNLKWMLDCKAKAAEPTGFNISYCRAVEMLDSCPLEAGMTYEKVPDETTVEHLVRNLHPYTNYIFNIAILTEIGLSKWSSSVRVQTKADKPSGSPRQLEARAKGQGWVLLAWEPPLDEERNGRIVKYIVNSEPLVKQMNVMANTTSDVTMYNVTGLEPYTKYVFKVTPCTEGPRSELCGEEVASLDVRTRIGAPGKIESIDQEDQQLEWEHDECNAPQCSYELRYRMNGTDHQYISAPGQSAANFKDMNITCTEHQVEIKVGIRAISINEDGTQLTGPWKEKMITCHIPVMEWWIILIIVAVCIVVTLILVGVGTYGWDQIKVFQYNLNLDLDLPDGLDPNDVRNFHPSLTAAVEGKKPWYKNIQILREKKISTSTATSNTSEEQDLIKPGSERQGRNLSGDSGTSEGDPGDSSGCSVGGESDSSSGSDRVHQSSDSGTVQEEPGFPAENKKWSGSVRLRTPGPPYVRQGMPEKISDMGGYVSVGSVPNLAGGMTGLLSLQQSTPSLALGALPEVPLGARRTSTGYISMPDTDAEGINLPLDVLGNFTFPHEGRAQSGFPAYSRHNFSNKKGSTPELSQYTKAESLPWLNTGYVAVAQAEGVMRDAPSAGGYVALGDGIGGMKRQPSLPSLPFGMDKSITTPDEDLPPGAYCRVGARGSPGPPPPFSTGYVSITQDLASQTTPTITSSSSVNKSPYVTCAMAEAIASPKKEPEKVKADYVSVGEMPNGCWAHPVIPPSTSDESREVTSAPLEGSRGRPSLPARPNTSETNHNRAGNRWTPLGPSLSKQSSGYVSGNVSQETLAFHDPVVMSPKKLLARSHEPHSVVFSPNHKSSMV